MKKKLTFILLLIILTFKTNINIVDTSSYTTMSIDSDVIVSDLPTLRSFYYLDEHMCYMDTNTGFCYYTGDPYVSDNYGDTIYIKLPMTKAVSDGNWTNWSIWQDQTISIENSNNKFYEIQEKYFYLVNVQKAIEIYKTKYYTTCQKKLFGAWVPFTEKIESDWNGYPSCTSGSPRSYGTTEEFFEYKYITEHLWIDTVPTNGEYVTSKPMYRFRTSDAMIIRNIEVFKLEKGQIINWVEHRQDTLPSNDEMFKQYICSRGVEYDESCGEQKDIKTMTEYGMLPVKIRIVYPSLPNGIELSDVINTQVGSKYEGEVANNYCKYDPSAYIDNAACVLYNELLDIENELRTQFQELLKSTDLQNSTFSKSSNLVLSFFIPRTIDVFVQIYSIATTKDNILTNSFELLEYIRVMKEQIITGEYVYIELEYLSFYTLTENKFENNQGVTSVNLSEKTIIIIAANELVKNSDIIIELVPNISMGDFNY